QPRGDGLLQPSQYRSRHADAFVHRRWRERGIVGHVVVADHAVVAAASRVVAFSTLGSLGVTQDLARTCLRDMEGADPELVAEETLVMVSIVTARAAEAALKDRPALYAAVSEALM